MPGRPYEQLFFHLDFDAVDRLAPSAKRAAAAAAFLRTADGVVALRKAKSPEGGEGDGGLRRGDGRPRGRCRR